MGVGDGGAAAVVAAPSPREGARMGAGGGGYGGVRLFTSSKHVCINEI